MVNDGDLNDNGFNGVNVHTEGDRENNKNCITTRLILLTRPWLKKQRRSSVFLTRSRFLTEIQGKRFLGRGLLHPNPGAGHSHESDGNISKGPPSNLFFPVIFDPPQQLFCTSYNNDIQEAELLQLNEITNEATLYFIKTWKHLKIWHLKVSFEQFLQLHLCQKAAEVVSEEAIKQAFGVSLILVWVISKSS